jgi:type IV secretory pathway VirB2 component (pilin)
MKKTMTIFSAALLAAAFFLFVSHAQMAANGSNPSSCLLENYCVISIT